MAKSVYATVDTSSSAVLFVERDGIFWLRGEYLERARELLQLNLSGNAVGFDSETASMYVRRLLDNHRQVGIARGNVVRLITRTQFGTPKKVEGTSIYLAPELLFGHRELDRLGARLGQRQGFAFNTEVDRIQTELITSQIVDPRDLGILVVYQAAGYFEVDWDLTTISRLLVEALAVAAYHMGGAIRCQLVMPKTMRKNRRGWGEKRVVLAPEQVLVVEDPADADYQQLELPW